MIKKTDKIFYQNMYQKNCSAQVCFQSYSEESNKTLLRFTQTTFYPLGGGQPGDRGEFILSADNKKIQIIDTRYAEGSFAEIDHIVAGRCDDILGAIGELQLDWPYRWKNMKLHSLLHLVYIAFENIHGPADIIGSSISQRARLDLVYFDDIDLEKIQRQIEKYIHDGHPIITKKLLCTQKNNDRDKRVWLVDAVGEVPCGGTHPKNTSELGAFSLKRKGLGKQGQRIYCSLLES